MTKTEQPTAADSNRLHRDLATAVVAFHEMVARRMGMTAAERKCAGILCALGITTPRQLAEATGLTTGAITGIVDRLERAGFAERTPNPADRRSVLVHARRSEELIEMTGRIFASLSAAMNQLDARYSDAERALIHRHLADTIDVLRAEAAKLATPSLG
ncbi:MAG TPA: MarR family transcriptional regulator [Allosphingosinicella sp.]|jgi:DNA-binding MarR family transcriptional regulator|nr:MarR family transcriptional regulator [Allosphingosinicella sp.]